MSATAPQTPDGAPAPPVVVGVDGSEASRRALAWAVRLAPRLGSRVDVVQVSDDVFTAHRKGYCTRDQAEQWSAAARDEGLRTMRTILDELAVDREQVDVALEVIPGQPGEVLIERSRDAELLVLGPRGMGRVRLLLGSVSLACLQRASCPVVIVRDAQPEEA